MGIGFNIAGNGRGNESMKVQGSDCSIVIKTAHREMDIPYSDETLREAVSFLQEEANIEGDGVCRGIRKISGVTGCVVSPLTIGTAPLLLYLAMGAAGLPLFVSETLDLFKYELNLLPTEDTEQFDLIQDRKNERVFFEGCRVHGFELRVMRDETIKLKLEICGERAPRAYPYTDIVERESGERFKGDNVTYKINGQEYTNIYGITLVSKKQGGTNTELWIKRALQNSGDIPAVIDEMCITAQLLKDKYEFRYYGTFRITLKRLVLISDETEVNASGAVISPLRFYVSGRVSTEVFTSGEGVIP
jgi:hypothetical protein